MFAEAPREPQKTGLLLDLPVPMLPILFPESTLLLLQPMLQSGVRSPLAISILLVLLLMLLWPPLKEPRRLKPELLPFGEQSVLYWSECFDSMGRITVHYV
jgi:hypothetical protein